MKVDPLAFAVLLPSLWAAHNVGDHVAQTDHQANRKSKDWSAMAGHIATYQGAQAVAVGAVLAATGLRCGRWGLLAGTVISAASHAFIDRRWPVAAVLEATGSPDFADLTVSARRGTVKFQFPQGMYLADQALHHGCLFVAALAMAARRG
jgi:hypothetical protein